MIPDFSESAARANPRLWAYFTAILVILVLLLIVHHDYLVLQGNNRCLNETRELYKNCSAVCAQNYSVPTNITFNESAAWFDITAANLRLP